ncbi:hypothetical protein [Streptomyces sp. NBC_01362]|uniref:hypothetical protein n=1 Tax=Streptomyces sp. NBC_01362 TaxID=2903839 RepID=UPI002E31654C|nr:hypothetical protein [Streptomyces sp. NBC_01362]
MSVAAAIAATAEILPSFIRFHPLFVLHCGTSIFGGEWITAAADDHSQCALDERQLDARRGLDRLLGRAAEVAGDRNETDRPASGRRLQARAAVAAVMTN